MNIRPTPIRWDSFSEERPFIIKSQAMPGVTLHVWHRDGYSGPIPRADFLILTHSVFSPGRTHHVTNHHGFGYTRYDVRVAGSGAPGASR